MNFNKHSELEGKHAFLGASTYSWIRYSDEKLAQRYRLEMAKEMGTRLHALAAEHIRLRIKLPEDGTTLSMYVNDAIDFHMEPEKVLFYSLNCFGTADAIQFYPSPTLYADNAPIEMGSSCLRIHDLKTGTTRCSMDQLLIYAALFCLEYGMSPNDINIVLRIYKDDRILEKIPEPYEVLDIMETIPRFDREIDQLRLEEGL